MAFNIFLFLINLKLKYLCTKNVSKELKLKHEKKTLISRVAVIVHKTHEKYCLKTPKESKLLSSIEIIYD